MITQPNFFGTAVAFCECCGRPLSDPASVQRGIGPICAGKAGQDDGPLGGDIADTYIPLPIEDDIFLQRTSDGVRTNVPHVLVQHSPTGYEWGFGGSGPADLALNLAEAMLVSLEYQGPRMDCYRGSCFELAYQMHQDLKWRFIAPVNRVGDVIPYEAVKAWVVGWAVDHDAEHLST